MSLPCLPTTSSCLVVTVTLAQSTRLLACSGKTTGLTVLVNRVDDPVDAGITADSLVLRVNEDDLEVLVGRVLVDPVRIQDTQIGTTATDTLLCGGLKRSLVLQLVHTLIGWLAESSTLWYWLLATSTTNSDTVDDIALLSLVT